MESGLKHGFKGLSYQLTELFNQKEPDFEKAEELIRLGADINDNDGEDENVLSESIFNYLNVSYAWSDRTDSTWNDPQRIEWDNERGTKLIAIIRFFLSHGYDVHRNDNQYGAMCLSSIFMGRFGPKMIEATKVLLDAGAVNAVAYTDDQTTAKDCADTEGGFADVCEKDHHLGNLYEAIYQILDAKDKGKPYAGIDSYQKAIGKRIRAVLADEENAELVFHAIDTPESKHDHCFSCNLYLALDDGYLVCRQAHNIYYDVNPPEMPWANVSSSFQGMAGCTIKGITFSNNTIIKGKTHYQQPVTELHLSSGKVLCFTTNFGEMENKESFGYFYTTDEISESE